MNCFTLDYMTGYVQKIRMGRPLLTSMCYSEIRLHVLRKIMKNTIKGGNFTSS